MMRLPFHRIQKGAAKKANTGAVLSDSDIMSAPGETNKISDYHAIRHVHHEGKSRARSEDIRVGQGSPCRNMQVIILRHDK